MGKKIEVLLVDDSALVRDVLSRSIQRDADIVVIGTAPDPYIARDQIVKLRPDVVVLDLEMPKMDGLTFLKKLMFHYPLPIIILSSLTAHSPKLVLEAIEHGAVDVMNKPSSAHSIGDVTIQLIDKIKAAARVKVSKQQGPRIIGSDSNSVLSYTIKHEKYILIGASTGGTVALEKILTRLPENCPPVVVVQHMPENFTKSFAERLNNLCKCSVKEAENGDALESGRVLIAPGNFHVLVKTKGTRYYVEVKDGPLVSRHRPSVDVLFKSGAKELGDKAIGVILTGMGADGASGMKLLADSGAVNIAQNEETCVVFGMPKEAIAFGGVKYTLPIDDIASKIISLS